MNFEKQEPLFPTTSSPESSESIHELMNEIRENMEEIYPSEEKNEAVAVIEIEETAQQDFSNEQKALNWQARTGLNEDTLCGAIETLVFMSERPLSLIKLKSMIDKDIELQTLHTAVLRLQEEYDKSYHGLRLVEVAEGYQFRTRPAYAKFIQRMFKVSSLMLTPTALEVLAIIAYRGPLSRTDIDKIRGVDSSHIVRALMDKRLVKILKRGDDLGRMVQYATTDEFLEMFNLKDLKDLPPEYELEAMAKTNEVGEISDIKTMVKGNTKGTFYLNDLEELDQLDKGLKAIAVETPFLQSLKQEDKIKIQQAVTSVQVQSPELNTPMPSEPPREAKSAFDLLEEFVQKNEIAQQNLAASQSVSQAEILSFMFPALAPLPISEETVESEIEEKIEVKVEQEAEIKAEAENPMDQWLDNEEFFDVEESDEENSLIISEQIVKDASELDLDLSFLKRAEK